MNLGQAHLSARYEGKQDQVCSILIEYTGTEDFNGTENFEVSDTEMVTFFYEGGRNGRPIETTYFYIAGEPGTRQSKNENEYECFHIDDINEISAEKAEELVGLS